MPRAASVPHQLSFLPFSGSRAVADGLISRRMLAGPTWCRLLPDVYVHAASFDPDDHRMWCDAVALKLPAGAAVGGLSAAYLWGVDLLPRRGPVHVVLPRTGRIRRHPRIAVTHSTLAVDDALLFGTVPVTTEVHCLRSGTHVAAPGRGGCRRRAAEPPSAARRSTRPLPRQPSALARRQTVA